MSRAFKACACSKCVNACADGNPGWFAPGEAEKAAALMGMTFKDFKAKYLIIDYWLGRNSIEVLAPVKMDLAGSAPIEPTGSRVSWGYAFKRGRCTFLGEDDRCRIHPAKPSECRETMCCETKPKNIRRRIAAAWARYWRKKDGAPQ